MNKANKNFENVQDYLNSMERVISLIYSTFDFNELMNRLLVAASEAINCETATISFRDGENWIVRYSYGFGFNVIGSVMNYDEEKHAVLAIEEKQPIIIYNTLEDDRVNKEHLLERNIKSVIVVPLICKEEVIGTIFFNYHETAQKFNKLVIEFIKSLSSSISLALQHVIEYEAHQTTLKRYQSLFESIDEGFCVMEILYNASGNAVDYRFIEVNPALERITGYKSAKGKLRSEVNPDGEDHWLEVYSKVAREGKPIRYINKSHSRWFSVYAFKVDFFEENSISVLFKDITEDMELKSKLEKALKTQDEIFVNISHELKTPINVIFSTIQLFDYLLKLNDLDLFKKKASKGIKLMKQNCFRLIKLINNIVDISKFDAGYLKLNLKNEDIVKVISDIVQSISDFIQSKELSIIFESNVSQKIIAFDAEKIERIMLNLISNSIKFTDKGKEIYVSVFDRNDFVEIVVRDTGIGMDQKNLDLIFNRFHQVDRTLSRNADGSGIGLSIVKSIVSLHGGEIRVESQPSEGTTIYFSLPVKLVADDCSQAPSMKSSSRIDRINVEFSDIYRL